MLGKSPTKWRQRPDMTKASIQTNKNTALKSTVKCISLVAHLIHYENMPMQYKEIFKVVKNENFPLKNFDIFLIFAQNIDCGYTLEPPRRVPTIYVLEQK